MNASDAAAWFAALVTAIGLVWTGASRARERRARAQSERAEQAARLLALMRDIELGGTDPTLDIRTVRARHAAQLQDLQRVIRIGTADFVARSLKPPVARTMIVVAALYALLLFGVGFTLAIDGGNTESERIANFVVGVVYIVLGIGGAVMAAVMLDRRNTHFAQLAAAAAERTEAVEKRNKRHQN